MNISKAVISRSQLLRYEAHELMWKKIKNKKNLKILYRTISNSLRNKNGSTNTIYALSVRNYNNNSKEEHSKVNWNVNNKYVIAAISTGIGFSSYYYYNKKGNWF